MRVLKSVLNAIIAHARETSPRECCGILLAGGSNCATVKRTLRAENAEEDCPEQGYVLGHQAHLQAVRMEARSKLRIVGYYHSHPQGGPQPSLRDRGEAVAGMSYLIVGIGDNGIDCAAWRLEGKRLVPEPLEVTE